MRAEHKAAIYFTFSLGIIPALTCLIRFVVLNMETGQPNLVCKQTSCPRRAYKHTDPMIQTF
jgi:hypothetical protein